MSIKFTIAETDSFAKKIRKPDFIQLLPKLHDYVYPILRENPFFGPNIKRLKGSYSAYYRYRIGKYRLFYTIDKDKILVFIIDIEKRKDAYR